jgi:hypothetical protein
MSQPKGEPPFDSQISEFLGRLKRRTVMEMKPKKMLHNVWNKLDQSVFPLRTKEYMLTGYAVQMIGKYDVFKYLWCLSTYLLAFVEYEFGFNGKKARQLYNKNHLPIPGLSHEITLETLRKCRTAHERYIRQIINYQLRMFFETPVFGNVESIWGKSFVNNWRTLSGSRFAYDLPFNYETAQIWDSHRFKTNFTALIHDHSQPCLKSTIYNHSLRSSNNSDESDLDSLISEPLDDNCGYADETCGLVTIGKV